MVVALVWVGLEVLELARNVGSVCFGWMQWFVRVLSETARSQRHPPRAGARTGRLRIGLRAEIFGGLFDQE